MRSPCRVDDAQGYLAEGHTLPPTAALALRRGRQPPHRADAADVGSLPGSGLINSVTEDLICLDTGESCHLRSAHCASRDSLGNGKDG